jgi:S1-C subfamily serine protease
VKEKNPDAAGKLQKGDVIVEVDGRKDLTESGVLALLMNKKPGSTVDLTFLRAGQSQKVSLQIP